jgi:beta-xylosidase
MVLGRVNEGPSIVKHDGIYYLTYSANDYRSQLYGIGYATASSPVGQWTKYVNNPVLQNPVDYLVGTGHGSVFTDKEGKLKYVFHAHYSTLEINPRTMHIAEVAFINNEMKIGGTIINPVIVK